MQQLILGFTSCIVGRSRVFYFRFYEIRRQLSVVKIVNRQHYVRIFLAKVPN